MPRNLAAVDRHIRGNILVWRADQRPDRKRRLLLPITQWMTPQKNDAVAVCEGDAVRHILSIVRVRIFRAQEVFPKLSAQVMEGESHRTISLGIHNRNSAVELTSPHAQRSIVPPCFVLNCATPGSCWLAKLALANAAGVIFVEPDLRAIGGPDVRGGSFARIKAVVHQRPRESVTQGAIRRGVVRVGAGACQAFLV